MPNVLQNQKHMKVICSGIATGGHKTQGLTAVLFETLSVLEHDAVNEHVVPNCVKQSSSISLSSIRSQYNTSKHLELLPLVMQHIPGELTL